MPGPGEGIPLPSPTTLARIAFDIIVGLGKSPSHNTWSMEKTVEWLRANPQHIEQFKANFHEAIRQQSIEQDLSLIHI